MHAQGKKKANEDKLIWFTSTEIGYGFKNAVMAKTNTVRDCYNNVYQIWNQSTVTAKNDYIIQMLIDSNGKTMVTGIRLYLHEIIMGLIIINNFIIFT